MRRLISGDVLDLCVHGVMEVLARSLLLSVFLWLIILEDVEGGQETLLSLAVRSHGSFWAFRVGSYPKMTVMGAGKGEILLML